MRVIWAPRAVRRAAEIARYIAQDSPDAAREWVEQVFAKAATLSRHPRQGRRVPEVDRDDIRQLLHGQYRLVYRIDPKRVVVLTVRHGRRLWDPDEILGA